MQFYSDFSVLNVIAYETMKLGIAKFDQLWKNESCVENFVPVKAPDGTNILFAPYAGNVIVGLQNHPELNGKIVVAYEMLAGIHLKNL